MSKQLLNIIDESGNIIGTESREIIHSKGLLHKEVHVWFVTPSGEIIFQKRSGSKDTYPNLLDATVGGHVEIGDDYVSTALKEMHEETGVAARESDIHLIEIIRSKQIDSVTGNNNNFLRAIFTYKYYGKLDDLKKEKGEGIGFESYCIDELTNLTEKERNKFIPKVIDEMYMSMFKRMIKF